MKPASIIQLGMREASPSITQYVTDKNGKITLSSPSRALAAPSAANASTVRRAP